MPRVSSIKGHFDGNAVVLDEPASLTVGQVVRVVFEAGSTTSVVTNGEGLDERETVNVEPLDRVPPDFIRRPGSAAGSIEMAPDFDATPDDFKEYL